MLKTMTKLITGGDDKAVKRLRPVVDRLRPVVDRFRSEVDRLWTEIEEINALEPDFERLSNEDLRAKTDEFKDFLEAGSGLDDIRMEAFAAVREAAKRTIGMRHFDVQLIGGIVLHQGKIAEMKTGEGKTLVATLPTYLNALTGKGVHVVTVNDYLAKRDAQWMGGVYHALGASIATLQHQSAYLYDPTVENPKKGFENLRPISRKDAYLADITYGTNSEFGFDYLRDAMSADISQSDIDQRVQRERHYAIVDEVDNILIDEARTPLIISGEDKESAKDYKNYKKISRFVATLEQGIDYTIDEKLRSASLTPEGMTKIERKLDVKSDSSMYHEENFRLARLVENALKAHAVFQRDREYVVKDREVVIVDEFTGRLTPGRRFSDGLHQAIEAKENVPVQRESITYATITLQNYFRMYHKLAGMTGTAVTEAEEFWKIYDLEVVEVPTNLPMIREDKPDLVYMNQKSKYKAIGDEIEARHELGQPVLVGTTDISKSEIISKMLSRRKIKHEVLNAKQHEREALVIAQAGRPGAVTVATNMAGRGTDIVLGGNPEFLDELTKEQWERDHRKIIDLGGLFILGSEKHEARRIDNQLRGRSGRQGDPGESRFYVALDDDLLRRFGGDSIKNIMGWAGLEEDSPLENKMVTKSIQGSQVKVESHHFDIRKHLVEYDDVVNTHRQVIYEQRDKVLAGSDIRSNVKEMVEKELTAILDGFLEGVRPDDWDVDGLIEELRKVIPLDEKLGNPDELIDMSIEAIYDDTLALAERRYSEMEEESFTPDVMRHIERDIMLRVIDPHWVQHLTSMENLRQGIGLYSYGQRDPLVMYKTRGYEQFQTLLERIQSDVARTIYKAPRIYQVRGAELRDDGPSARRGRSRPTDAPAGRPSRSQAAPQPPPQQRADAESNGQPMSRAERRARKRMEKKAAKRR